MNNQSFRFTFFRFTGSVGQWTTEVTRDYSIADGMKGLVDMRPDQIKLATERAINWATSKGLSIIPKNPFPSLKYPGKAWLEFRFTGLTL